MLTRRHFIPASLLLLAAGCAEERPVTWMKSFPVGPDLTKLRLLWQDAAGKKLATLQAAHDHLQRQGETPLVLMNSGIFGTDHAPLGLHVSEGKELRPINRKAGEGNFYLEPNGVFSVSPDHEIARIQRTGNYREAQPSLAVQSGPLLVEDGQIHPQFRKDSQSTNIRNGIGITKDGSVVLAISTQKVSLYDFAAAFRDHLHCPNALYLDGAISQAWSSEENIENLPKQDFAGILAIIK